MAGHDLVAGPIVSVDPGQEDLSREASAAAAAAVRKARNPVDVRKLIYPAGTVGSSGKLSLHLETVMPGNETAPSLPSS